MDNTIVWSKVGCPFCDQAINLLNEKGIGYEVRTIGQGWTKFQLLEVVPTATTVPQIFLEGEYIGGFTELEAHFSQLEETNVN